MIGMAGNGAVRTKGEHNVRSELANMEGQVADHFVKILTVKLAVGIIQHDSAGYFQDFTSSGKLLPPRSG